MVKQLRTLFGLFGLVALLGTVALLPAAPKQNKPATEDDYYQMVTIPVPDDIVLEVGGLEWLDEAKERLMACTRRGEIWLIDKPYDAEKATFKRMQFGLHEPLGMLRRPDGIYLAQRAELTRLRDTDKDDLFDELETICNDWQISGSYHEYAFGPKVDPDGNLWITLNRPFDAQPEGKAAWRGWAMKIDSKGKMHPVCCGLRSPAGLGTNAEGDMFFTDNQGDWVPVCKLSHMTQNSFHGNDLALPFCNLPQSPMKHPGNPPNGLLYGEAKKKYPILKLPAVWFPYPQMGKSHSDILCDQTGGKFGPFDKQLFVGDQANSVVLRVFLEKIGGEYQGACFPFRQGFQCGVLRMCWGKDGSMFCGRTNRGWGSSGGKPHGLQRLVWTGKTPFEVHEMRAKPDGFELTFTQPVDPRTAGDVKSYGMDIWTYRYHSNYGDQPRDTQSIPIKQAIVGTDGRSVRLIIDGMKETYVHAIKMNGVRSANDEPLLHAEGYYTLNSIPKQ